MKRTYKSLVIGALLTITITPQLHCWGDIESHLVYDRIIAFIKNISDGITTHYMANKIKKQINVLTSEAKDQKKAVQHEANLTKLKNVLSQLLEERKKNIALALFNLAPILMSPISNNSEIISSCLATKFLDATIESKSLIAGCFITYGHYLKNGLYATFDLGLGVRNIGSALYLSSSYETNATTWQNKLIEAKTLASIQPYELSKEKILKTPPESNTPIASFKNKYSKE